MIPASVLSLLNTDVLSKVTKVDLLVDLKALTPVTGMKVQMIGSSSLTDGRGGLYYWDPSSVLAADATNLNVVVPNDAAFASTGRWIRVFQRVRTTAGGATVLSIGPVKLVFMTGTTDGNGDYTANMTEEGTANGTAIFSTLWWYDARATSSAATVSNAVQTYFKSLTGTKSIVYGNYKANALTITLGLLYNPFATVGSGVSMLGWAAGV